MTGELRVAGDQPEVRCFLCGAPAAGPCARCRRPVCGDCSVLTEGGATTFAICTACDRRGGRSLGRPWLSVLGLLGGIVALALLALAALVLLHRH